VNLSDLVRSEGYGFVVDPEPHRRPDVLGDPPDPDLFGALLCGDGDTRLIVCRADCWDYAYDCSHEIAEDRYGHRHGEALFSMQANILAGWCRQLSDPAGDDNEGEQ
jgi:hypothetical protein